MTLWGSSQAETPGPGRVGAHFSTALPSLAPAQVAPLPLRWGSLQCHHLLLLLSADAEQSGSPRAGMGSDQEDSKPITLGESGDGEGGGVGEPHCHLLFRSHF